MKKKDTNEILTLKKKIKVGVKLLYFIRTFEI